MQQQKNTVLNNTKNSPAESSFKESSILTLVKDYGWITFAAAITAVAVNFFFTSTGLAPGGYYRAFPGLLHRIRYSGFHDVSLYLHTAADLIHHRTGEKLWYQNVVYYTGNTAVYEIDSLHSYNTVPSGYPSASGIGGCRSSRGTAGWGCHRYRLKPRLCNRRYGCHSAVDSVCF